MTTHVFTYGSLMFDAVWTRVVDGRYRTLDGTLADHARFAVREQDYPGMVKARGSTVRGVVHLDVVDDDMQRLDRFEGVEYLRDDVVVACADGIARSCGTYLFLPTGRLLESPWDPSAFALDRFLATYCRDWPAG